MFKFYKVFTVITVLDYLGYDESESEANERFRQFADVAKHFGLALSHENHVVKKRKDKSNPADNIVKFGTDEILRLSWECVTTPENWERFCNEVNDYVKGKNYADFSIYEAPQT